MSKIPALTAKRHNLITAATELRASIKDDMTEAQVAEVNTKFDAAMNDADTIAAEIDREQRLADATRSLANSREQRQAGREDQREEDQDGDRGGNAAEYRAAFQTYLRSGTSDLSQELRALLRGGYIAEGETRAQSVGTTTAGGYTVPRQFMDELVKTLKDFGPMMDGGIVRELVTAGGAPIDWPTTDDTAKVGVATAENTAPTSEGDVVFGTKSLGAFKFSSGPILVSNELLEDSGLDIEAIIAELMGERIARVANAKLTTGAGTTEPLGIVTGASLGVTAASATVIAPDELITFYHSINSAYRRNPKFRFMFADSTLSALRKLKDTQNRYLISNLRDSNASIEIAGINVPYVVNDDMAAIGAGARVIVAGDFSRYIVRKARAFAVRRLAERWGEADQVGFVGFTRLDGQPVDTSAIKYFRML